MLKTLELTMRNRVKGSTETVSVCVEGAPEAAVQRIVRFLMLNLPRLAHDELRRFAGLKGYDDVEARARLEDSGGGAKPEAAAPAAEGESASAAAAPRPRKR